jgi:hypothetical protein
MNLVGVWLDPALLRDSVNWPFVGRLSGVPLGAIERSVTARSSIGGNGVETGRVQEKEQVTYGLHAK